MGSFEQQPNWRETSRRMLTAVLLLVGWMLSFSLLNVVAIAFGSHPHAFDMWYVNLTLVAVCIYARWIRRKKAQPA